MVPAAKEEMLSGFGPWCADLPLAASFELSENSRQGFARKNAALHLGQAVCNSTTALGIERGLLQSRGGSRIQTWNRYAYVTNNPLSFTDSLGLNQDACGPHSACGPNGAPGSSSDPGFSFSPGGTGGVFGAFAGGQVFPVYDWIPDVEGSFPGPNGSIDGGNYYSTLIVPQYFFGVTGYVFDLSGGSQANNGPTPVSCNSTTGICVPRSMVPPPGYSVLQQLKNKVVGFLCGSSPSGAIESWMEAGATKGAFTGAVAGAGIFGAPTFGIGGVPGAALGGTVGGIAGAGGGVLGGSMAAVVCSATGVYGSGS
jgi:hypothetical protein